MSTKSYDTIVVGAGLSGLSAAGYLAKGGQKVLIVEANPFVGGCLKNSDIQGCKMSQVLPVATKLSYGDSNGWIKAAQDFGADVRVLPAAAPRAFILGSNTDLTIPRCLSPEAGAKWVLELIEITRPDLVEEGLLDDLIPIFKEIYGATQEQLSVGWGETTVEQWLTPRTSKEGIRFVFNMLLASFFCTCEGEYTWKYGSVGKAFTQLRAWLGAEGTMTIALPNAQEGIAVPLADAIIDNYGVEIRLSTNVNQVLIEDGKAVGVELTGEDGNPLQIFSNDVAVSSRWATLEGLFNPLPEFIKSTIDDATAPEHIMGSAFGFYILDESIELDPAYFMVFDPELGSHVLGGSAQSAEQPWNTPEGKQFVWSFRIQTQEHFEAKGMEQTGIEMEDNLELLFPGFKNAITWKMPIGGRMAPSHWFYNSMPKIQSSYPEISNLYFAGDSTSPMLGILTDGATSTGYLVAQEILSK